MWWMRWCGWRTWIRSSGRERRQRSARADLARRHELERALGVRRNAGRLRRSPETCLPHSPISPRPRDASAGPRRLVLRGYRPFCAWLLAERADHEAGQDPRDGPPADAEVTQPGRANGRRVEGVLRVEQEIATHDAARSAGLSVRYSGQSVASTTTSAPWQPRSVRQRSQPRELADCGSGRLRVAADHRRTAIAQHFRQRERRGIPDVIGPGLEGEAQQATRLPPRSP